MTGCPSEAFDSEMDVLDPHRAKGFKRLGKLKGDERKLFRELLTAFFDACAGGLNGEANWVGFADSSCRADRFPLFMQLSPFHRVSLVADIAIGLLCEDEPLPPENIIHYAAFVWLLNGVKGALDVELDMDDDFGLGFDEERERITIVTDVTPERCTPAKIEEAKAARAADIEASMNHFDVRMARSAKLSAADDVLEHEVAKAATKALKKQKKKMGDAAGSMSELEKESPDLLDEAHRDQLMQRVKEMATGQQKAARPIIGGYFVKLQGLAGELEAYNGRVGRVVDMEEVSTAPLWEQAGGISRSDMMAEILREMTEGNPTNYEVAVPSADAPRSKLDVIWVRGENVTAAAPGPDNGDFGYAARWRSSLLATVKERSAGRMEQVERLGLAERAFASQRTTETIIQRYQPTCWDSSTWDTIFEGFMRGTFEARSGIEHRLIYGTLDPLAVLSGDRLAAQIYLNTTRRIDEATREFEASWKPYDTIFHQRVIVMLGGEHTYLEKSSMARYEAHRAKLLEDFAKIKDDIRSLEAMQAAASPGQTDEEIYQAYNEQLSSLHTFSYSWAGAWRRQIENRFRGKEPLHDDLDVQLAALRTICKAQAASGELDIEILLWGRGPILEDATFGKFQAAPTPQKWAKAAAPFQPWKSVDRDTKHKLRQEQERRAECFHCKRTPEGDERFMICSRCKIATYCSRSCQSDDWAAHKKDCKRWKKEREKALAGQKFSVYEFSKPSKP